MNDIERAERMQAWKAFLIPSTLFVACLLNAAGIYILYAGNSAGMIFLGLGIATIIGGMFAFITFQNQQRAGGQWKRLSDDLPDHVHVTEDSAEDGESPDETPEETADETDRQKVVVG